MRKLVHVYEIGDLVPSDTFAHQSDYQPQPGEVIAVRNGADSGWLIRRFIRHTDDGLRVECKSTSETLTLKWSQWSPNSADRSANGAPKLTFESVVQTLFEADVIRAVEYKAKGVVCSLRFDATEADLQEALDIVKMDQIYEQALAKLSEIERKALGL